MVQQESVRAADEQLAPPEPVRADAAVPDIINVGSTLGLPELLTVHVPSGGALNDIRFLKENLYFWSWKLKWSAVRDGGHYFFRERRSRSAICNNEPLKFH